MSVKRCAGLVACLVAAYLVFPSAGRPAGKSGLTDAQFRGMASIYGFYAGQSTLVNEYIRQHEDLQGEFRTAKRAFDDRFGATVLFAAKTLLSEEPQAFKAMKDSVKMRVDMELGEADLSRAGALAFLAVLKRRVKGEQMPHEALAPLLFFKYRAHAEREMIEGFTAQYDTSGHPKALGLRLTLSYPVSWRASESERPYNVQEFENDYADAHEFFAVQVRELPDEFPDEQAALDYLKSSIEPIRATRGATVRTVETATLESQPAISVELDVTRRHSGQRTALRALHFGFVYRTHLILYTCGVAEAGNITSQLLARRYDRIDGLCWRMINSTHLLDRQGD